MRNVKAVSLLVVLLAALVGAQAQTVRKTIPYPSGVSGVAVDSNHGRAYVLLPDLLVLPFRSEAHLEEWEQVQALVPPLLRFVAVYCLFDSGNLIFSYALRGAGDTRFVTAVALGLSAGVLVLPTWLMLRCGGGLYAAWTTVSLYVILMALTFLFRFRRGTWKSMRVIETVSEEL